MVFSENLLRRTLSILSTNHGHFQKWIYSSCMNTENADCGLLTLVDSWPRSGFCLLHNKGFDWSRMRIVKPRKNLPPLSGSSYKIRPTYFRSSVSKGQTMRGQKDAREWPHIGRLGREKKVDSHLTTEQSPPCHKCTNALRLFWTYVHGLFT